MMTNWATAKVLLVILALVACGGGKSADHPTVDTANLFSSLPPPTPVDSTLRIIITSDAHVYADGRAVTLTSLDSLLAALKAANGEVWYYREPRGPGLTGQQDSRVDSVLTAITRHELSVSISRKPDFSDQSGKRRHPPRPDRP